MKNPGMVLIDTNVVLDVLLERADFIGEAQQIFDRVETGACHALLCATTVTTIDYLARKQLGSLGAHTAVAALLDLYDIAAVTRATLTMALASDMPDFEDAVLAHAAHQAGAQAIITRNLKDFAKSPVRAYTPTQFLALQAL